jgi:hypothetical protein
MSTIANLFHDSTLANLFFSVPFSILGLMLVATIWLAILRFARRAPGENGTNESIGSPTFTVIDAFFLGASVNFLFDSGGRIQIITVLSFSAALALATSLRPHPDRSKR